MTPTPFIAGNLGEQSPAAYDMDTHNNNLGIDIGNRLRLDPNTTWEDVVREARELIDPSNSTGDSARWLNQQYWGVNPKDDFGIRLPNTDPSLNFPNTIWPDGPYENIREKFLDDYFDATDEIREQIRDYINEFFDRYSEEFREIKDAINDFWTRAQNFLPRYDPLTFDLDGDGLETLGINPSNPILFDHDGDGIKHASGWVNSDDAFLVLDRNGNGTIDNGRELFGDNTIKSNGQTATDGFDALADLDTNHDGIINSSDAQFANLRLWRDLNQDGISQSNELYTLSQLGIAGINVASSSHSQTLANGNQIADKGTFIRTDGTEGEMGAVTGDMADINLAGNSFHREFPDQLDTTNVVHLPDMQGSGAVRDLRKAA